MPLSSSEIRCRINDTSIPVSERLVITPILDLDRQAKAGAAAVDVRLGQRFKIPRRSKLDRLDHISPQHSRNIQRYNDDHYVSVGDYFVLHPRQFVLGETLEWVHLPSDLAAYVVGRSSWGRDGLIIATAIGVHPGYSGILTLELTNLGEIPIRLYPGLTIAQLFLHEVGSPEEQVPALNSALPPSSFAGSTAPTSGNPAADDQLIIRRLAEKHGFVDQAAMRSDEF